MAWPDRILTAQLRATRLDIDCPPGALLGPLARQPGAVLLDSAALHESFGRYSLLACRPLEVLTLDVEALRGRDGRVISEASRAEFWPAMGTALTSVALTGDRPPADYLPGWIGYVGYEVARVIERLPARSPRDTHLPDLRMAFHDAILLYDAVEARWQLVELLFDDPPPGAGDAAKALREIASAAEAPGDESHPAPAEHADAALRPVPPDVRRNFTPDAYRRAVAKCVDYIAAGDIFQVNLSQRLTVPDAPDALAVYRALRRRNPASYAAYLSFESAGRPCAVLSSSPELFLRVRDGHVVTRPIKGTRPRVGQADADAAASADLVRSAKDNAELAMIIDLLRNDIGRVCRYGTVQVTRARELEVHPTVFHLVGTVEGQLCDGVDPAALLKATFPGGSITGAPKIRAMEIIDELEQLARGVYTGCIGHVGVDGACEWNIAIRTVVCDGSNAHVQVGGGIVADSQPDAEYTETLDKARAILEAIEEVRTATEPS